MILLCVIFLMENRVVKDPPSQLNGKFHYVFFETTPKATELTSLSLPTQNTTLNPIPQGGRNQNLIRVPGIFEGLAFILGLI